MQIIKDRRALHAIAELAFTLPETMQYLEKTLLKLNCTLIKPCESSICAFFDFGKTDALAFRTDCDALPIQEISETEYTSRHPGCMHACGHDGHMAMLLEFARRLDRAETMPHNVLLVFQPAEETIGGAKPICESGVFEKYNVTAIFGQHLWPGLEKGVVFSRAGAMMSRMSELDIVIEGRASHVGKYKEGIDAMLAGADCLQRIYDLEASLAPDVFRLLRFGRMESGVVRNAVSAKTRFEGTLRAFDDAVFDQLHDGILEILTNLDTRWGTHSTANFSEGYPAVNNPADLYQAVCDAVSIRELAEPVVISEDFSWYQRYIPGVFFFLGLGDDTPTLHSNNFDFDEQVLYKGVDFLENLAKNL